MIINLREALAQLNLQPGQSQRVRVNGYEVEIRRPLVECSDLAGAVTPDFWLDLPPSPTARPVTPTHQALPLPARLELDESDLAPAYETM